MAVLGKSTVNTHNNSFVDLHTETTSAHSPNEKAQKRFLQTENPFISSHLGERKTFSSTDFKNQMKQAFSEFKEQLALTPINQNKGNSKTVALDSSVSPIRPSNNISNFGETTPISLIKSIVKSGQKNKENQGNSNLKSSSVNSNLNWIFDKKVGSFFAEREEEQPRFCQTTTKSSLDQQTLNSAIEFLKNL